MYITFIYLFYVSLYKTLIGLSLYKTLYKTPIRVAKRNYSGKLRNKFSSSDSASVWKGMKDIKNYKTPSPALWRINNWQMILMSSIAGLKKTPHTCSHELLRAAFSPHCSSPSTPMTAHLKKKLCQALEVCRRHHTYRPYPGL